MNVCQDCRWLPFPAVMANRCDCFIFMDDDTSMREATSNPIAGQRRRRMRTGIVSGVNLSRKAARSHDMHRLGTIFFFFVFSAQLPGIVLGQSTSKSALCDDSKCQSPGIVALPYKLGGCWAEEGVADSPHVFGCSDGYDIYKLNATLRTFSYYTCCRPYSYITDDSEFDSELENVSDTEPEPTAKSWKHDASPLSSQRPRCSDQVCSSPSGRMGESDCWADGPYEPMTCSPKDASNIYKYPRKTGAFLLYNSVSYSYYTCCNTLDGSSPPLKPDYVIAEAVRVGIGSLAIICVLGLILGILSSAKTRKRSYNMYLIALAIPDLAYNILAIVTGSKALSGRDHISCPAMNAVGYFYMTANIYMNTVIAYMVHKLLRNSKRRKRTLPPSRQLVSKQIAAVYVLALCFALWGMFSVCGDIIDYTSHERTRQLVVTLTMLAVALIPFSYFTYVCVDVWRAKLLPRTGRTRILTLYFLKIVMVFVIFWVPAILLLNLEILSTTAEGKMHYAAWYLISIQGIASTVIAMLKPDVRIAVAQFFTCRHDNNAVDIFDDNISSMEERRSLWWTSREFGSSMGESTSSFFGRLSASFRRLSSVPSSFNRDILAVQQSQEAQAAIKEDDEWSDEERCIDEERSSRKVRFKRQSNRPSWNISSIASLTEEAEVKESPGNEYGNDSEIKDYPWKEDRNDERSSSLEIAVKEIRHCPTGDENQKVLRRSSWNISSIGIASDDDGGVPIIENSLSI